MAATPAAAPAPCKTRRQAPPVPPVMVCYGRDPGSGASALQKRVVVNNQKPAY
jgi:hypothetical protein